MGSATFYYWIFGVILSIGSIVLFSYIFNKKKVKPTYNFRDEKRVMALEITEDMQPIYELLLNRFREMNPLKLKKMTEESYELEARSIVSFLEKCENKQDVFMMMDEEFYRWNWSSPLYNEFYEALMSISEEVWLKINKKG